MAIRTVGTKGAAQLACLTNWTAIVPLTDIQAISAAINDDGGFGIPIMGTNSPYYVLATATTATSTALTVVTARAGSPAIGTIRVGDVVLGSYADIAPGTCVTAVTGGGATITLSQAARSTGTLKAVAFVRMTFVMQQSGIGDEGLLYVPDRGVLKVMNGDVVAVDATGWPILVSGNAISYPGSDWTLT